MVRTKTHEISTKRQGDAHDVTGVVARAVSESGLQAGIVTVFVVGSTAGVTTIEFTAGAIPCLGAVFEELAQKEGEYQHHLGWGNDNGSSHVRAALLGPSVTIPFSRGTLHLGTWTQVMLVGFETGP